MAFRLNEAVTKGEIDNRYKGRVVGKIWLLGREEPVRLNLEGNCLRDLAGSRFVFENLSPQPLEHAAHLRDEQEGLVGDMTASRKVETFELPFEEVRDMRKRGETVPTRLANCLYLEWFSKCNGRVVIELTDFRTAEISEPEWRMTKEEEQQQIARNVNAIHDYMDLLGEVLEQGGLAWDDDEDGPMDEFEWEMALRESDELTDTAMEVFDKYMDHPDQDKLIAREMGWDWLDDALDADERRASHGEGVRMREEEEADTNFEPLEPNPLTEGKDWIRREGDHIVHPLCHRASELAMGLWHRCKEDDLLGEEADDDLRDMYFEAQTLAAKLAGALNSLAYDRDPDAGFVVACLKRALKYVDAAVGACGKVLDKQLLDDEYVETYRRELFAIREEMLRFMQHFRSIL